MNWQWVAGTGTDSRFNRTYDVTRQAQRYDPDGDYVRRYVAELAGIPGPAVHEPGSCRPTSARSSSTPSPLWTFEKETNASWSPAASAERGKAAWR